jgi:hypothetical protein
MKLRPLVPLLLVLPLAAGAGCSLGSSDAGGGGEADDRAAAMACIQDKGVDAHFEGEEGAEEIVIGSGPGAPRIKFFLTGPEAEAEQFQGRGEGAEQIGATLLYVRDGSDDVLHDVEQCLADL